MTIDRISVAGAVILAGALAALMFALAPQASRPAEAQAGDMVSVEDCFGDRISLTRDEYRMLRMHNQARAERGIKRLCVHPKLQGAAREHSRDMLEKDYFSHLSRGGREDPGERLHRFGYGWSAYGENIGWGQGVGRTPEKIFDQWWSLQFENTHRKTILSKRYREVGLGNAVGHFDPGPGGPYPDASVWTVDFGSRD